MINPRMSSLSHKVGANKRISESVTQEFVDRIHNLSPSRQSDYLKECFLSKYLSEETDSPLLRRTRAIEKWLFTEVRNEATNERLMLTVDQFTILPDVEFLRFVEWTKRLIETTIGSVPPYEALIGTFSGGASTSRGRKASYPAGKYLGKAHATKPSLALFEDLFEEEMPGWASFRDQLDYQVVEGNVMFTVPKKTDIDRCACKEPDINMFLQKGLGGFIRRSLRTKGINLNDQSINRSLACSGSITGNLATIDLSSASDSVTYNLVELLLPELWFTLLSATRCEVTFIDGVEHRNEMFSSMGNGFTFELESLLFWALTKATCYFTGTSGVVSVYGDDIIAPTGVIDDLIWVLNYFGFLVNEDKSFWKGSFRESCGGHYYNGCDITPFYLRAPMRHLTDVIHMANSLRQWASNEVVGGVICDYDDEVYPIWSWLRDMVPEEFWGGRDCSNKYRLVTPHCARRRLEPETKKHDNGDGGYIHWLNLTYKRTFLEEIVESSSRSVELQRCRSRPVRNETVTSLTSVFRQELG